VEREAASRKSHRLAEFLYQLPGAYFVTFVSALRQCSLGNISHGQFKPSLLGEICRSHLCLLPGRHQYLALDEFVIMPNHVHMILFYENYTAEKVPPITQVIGWLKAGITRDFRKLGNSDEEVWQRDFHDHVIRTEEALFRIRNYISNNVLQWTLDKENPDKSGTDLFDLWWSDEIQSQASMPNRYVPLRREP
jgi:putative transposase